MARNKNRKQEKSVLENPETLAEQLSRTEQYLEKNKVPVLIVVAVIVLAVVGIFGYRYYINNQEKQAKAEIFQAMFYFESDSLNLALNGDGNNLGFLDIIDEFGSTPSGNLAYFYAGACHLKLGRYDEAIENLEAFSSGDLVLQARAYALIGDANMELQFFEEAAASYSKAADYKPNEYFTPVYLVKCAIAYERLSDFGNAIECYDRIINEFKDSEQYQDARKEKARLEQLSS